MPTIYKTRAVGEITVFRYTVTSAEHEDTERYPSAKFTFQFSPMARPERNLFASRSVRRALLTPQANPGSLYRCGERT